jgi:hypothetical protein
MKSYIHLLALVLLLSATTELYAGPRHRFSDSRTSVGLRLGWVGGPNGLSVRQVVAPGHAFEFVAGYSPKYGRRLDVPDIKKGNTFLSASYSPYFLVSEGNLGVSIYGDVGLRMNYHHYRYFEYKEWGPKLTPEVIGGIGMQIEFSERVELYGDLHVKYFNAPGNVYMAGIESGAGLRVALN